MVWGEWGSKLPRDAPRPSQAGNQLPGWQGKPPLSPIRMLHNWQEIGPRQEAFPGNAKS